MTDKGLFITRDLTHLDIIFVNLVNITRENVYLIEPVYDDITNFDRFATVVAKSGPFCSLIGVRTTTSARLNVPVLASNLLQLNLSEIGEFMDNGLALAFKAGKCGMLDYKGNWAIPCRYDSMDIMPMAATTWYSKANAAFSRPMAPSWWSPYTTQS